MPQVDSIRTIREVKSAVVCDLDGGLVEAYQEPDADGLAAVVAFVTVTLGQVGEELGLGELVSVTVAGAARGRVISKRGSLVLSASVEPVKALSTVLKTMEGA